MEAEKTLTGKQAKGKRKKEKSNADNAAPEVAADAATEDVCTSRSVKGTIAAASALHKKARKKVRARRDCALPPCHDETDYVLCFKQAEKRHQINRERFEKLLEYKGFEVKRIEDEGCCYVLLRCSFSTLATEAERIRLEMPLAGQKLKPSPSKCTAMIDRCFKTDYEEDYASAPFQLSKRSKFLNGDNEQKFFRPALRSLLVHSILSNLSLEEDGESLENKRGNLKVPLKGLAHLLLRKVYNDAFILHELSNEQKRLWEARGRDEGEQRAPDDKSKTAGFPAECSARDALNQLWPFPLKYQPMWMIRNYFGEEIALYFAWVGLLTWSIFLPALFGLAIFAYGIWLSVTSQSKSTVTIISNATNYTSFSLASSTTAAITITTARNLSATDAVTSTSNATSIVALIVSYGEDLLYTIKDALDNDLTPWYSIVICVWGTIFLELWKRRNAQLAFEWDVDGYEDNEVDRPEYNGYPKEDQITKEPYLYYSTYRRAAKILTSFSFLIIMVCIVIMTTVAVVVYRVLINVDHCLSHEWSSLTCTVMTSLVATTANAMVILLLSLLYEKLAYVLTNWENHRTTTQYKDALIVKLFAFLFTNNFASLYYIAFFRGNVSITGSAGILGLGESYVDKCSQNSTNSSCMSMLSLQILILIIIKPIISTAKEVFAPIMSKLKSKLRMVRPAGHNKVQAPQDEESGQGLNMLKRLSKENLRPPLGDFTLSQYADKIIQYGYLMIFAVAMPLAPIIVLIVNMVDRVIDSRRMLWKYRRPIALRAQDIGTWYYTLDFLNVCGVITNACLVAYTSKWGSEHLTSTSEKLAFILAYEHGVFAMKYFIAALVPDVSRATKKAMRREKFLVYNAMYGDTKPTDKPFERSQSEGHALSNTPAPHISAAKKSKSELPALRGPLKTLAESRHSDAARRESSVMMPV